MNMWWVACMHTPCWRSHRWFGNSAAWMLMFLTVASLSFIAWMCTPACRSHLCFFWAEWLDSMQHWAATPGRIFFSDRCRLHISICRARMLTWQCGSHPALSQCSIELPHPVFVTSLHRSVDEATLVVVFFPAAGKDVSNLSSRAKSSAWCCRPRQHSVFFFPDGRHRLGAALIFMPAWRRHMCFFRQEWLDSMQHWAATAGWTVCMLVCVLDCYRPRISSTDVDAAREKSPSIESVQHSVAAPGLPALRLTDPSMTQCLSVCLSGRRQKHVES